ncbi:MAG: tetratricopeptide repeat protein [Deltaproteobacteria bacterium]|nr:tetratricopeptide repeat protein [Deltaproteobacteria bacterium]
MAENQISHSLIERIRSGRAALVVGSSIGSFAGMPSWKKLLERMREELEKRASPGDHEAAADVAAFLKKGRLVTAAGFLGRTLGSEACDKVIADSWLARDSVPDALHVLGRIPVRAIWTVHPGDIVERAVQLGSPDGWPAPCLASYETGADLDTRRRYVLKLLGDIKNPSSYVLVATSVRRALSSASAYRSILEDLYRDGTLIFVGFRHGDPDLHALLERVLGMFEPPRGEHYFVGSGLGPVDIEELSAEHHMTAVPLEGHGGDEKSAESLLKYLSALAEACEKEGISLAVTRPGDDDLDGWLERLRHDSSDSEALDALHAMEKRARDNGQAERLVEILLARVEVEGDSSQRARFLREVARAFEKEIGDLPRAFTALTAALREDPTSEDALAEAERLAAETDGWGELVHDVSEIVPHIHDARLASACWVRLGRWYHEKLRHYDYAIASFREALKKDSRQTEAHRGLAEIYRKQQKWGELAEELAAHAEVENDAEQKIDLLLALADLHETQLASTSKAVESYEKAVDLENSNSEALTALERLYRRGERWGKLAGVLEKRADILDDEDPARAAAYRKELAQLRSEKLGDVEGAIGRYEAALEKNDRDVEALRALEKLYEKAGRAEDYLRTLERLAEAGPETERTLAWRRLANEVEEREGGQERAIRYYEKVLVLEPTAVDAYRSLERLYRARGNWDAVVELYERRIASVAMPSERVELYLALARLHEQELMDPHRAISAHVNALDISGENLDCLAALGRLYARVEAWDRAVAVLTKHAMLLGPGGADLYHQAGEIHAKNLEDQAAAEAHYVKALELNPAHVPSMQALIELYRQRRDFARAAKLMLEAERLATNRLEKVRLLFEAALIHEEWLDQPEVAFELHARVLALDPEHVEAGNRVAAQCVAKEQWADAEPVLEMLSRKTETTDRVEKGRREALLGRVAEALGKTEKAAKCYRQALETDHESLEAALGLASLLFASKEWEEAEKRYREILLRHRSALAEGQIVETWYRVGLAARHRGDVKTAENAFRRALERDPGHRPSLELIVELATERGDFKSVVEAKRNLLDGASEEARSRLFEEIGDLMALKLGDPMTALGAYLEALKLRPRSHAVLHKMLDLYTAQKEWRRAIETLGKIAELEKEPPLRAKYFYAAAVIARDELHGAEEAVSYFGRALDDAPTMPKAFEAIERILGDRGDWKGLSKAYRTMIARLGDRATTPQLLHLWTRLGDIALEKLLDPKSAIAAHEVAVALDPADTRRHETLAALYLDAGPDHAIKAVVELQSLLKKYPDRLDLYRSLSKLYADIGDVDKAYCLASALVFLGQASQEEQDRFHALKGKQLELARRRLTEELWQKAILHPREDRALNGIFASLMASLAAFTAQPHEAMGLDRKDQADLESHPHRVAKMFRYAVQTLGISPQPELYLREGSNDGFRAANMADKGLLVPAVLIGDPMSSRKADRETIFDIAKRLAFFRPERYVYYALATIPKLEAAVHAALAVTGVANGRHEPEIEKLKVHFKRTVPEAVLEQVAAFARKLGTKDGEAAVSGWITAADLSANRVGFILANDLETAARMIATEQGVTSTLSAKERLRELLSYSVSEEYFSVRKHLGLDVAATG